MTEQATALANPPTLITEASRLDADEYNLLWKQAQMAIRSGLLPKNLTKPEQVFIIMAKGRELGISPQYALNNIAVVNNKPTMGAELMLALIYSRHGDDAVRFKGTDRERCVIRYKRRTWNDYDEYSFDMQDAKLAGLVGKDTWKSYPAAMLRARCISAVARMAFPDCIAGFYTAEEMGAEVEVDHEGAVTIVQETTVEYSASANQLATIAKLARLLGKPEEPSEDMTSAEASERITELSRAYQERKGSAGRAEPVAASENPATDAARTEGLLQLSEAITALAEARSDDPKVVFQAGARHLGLQAQRSADLDLAEMEAVRGWAQTQLTLVHGGAHEPAVEVEQEIEV